jgi:hypothetical protein
MLRRMLVAIVALGLMLGLCACPSKGSNSGSSRTTVTLPQSSSIATGGGNVRPTRPHATGSTTSQDQCDPNTVKPTMDTEPVKSPDGSYTAAGDFCPPPLSDGQTWVVSTNDGTPTTYYYFGLESGLTPHFIGFVSTWSVRVPSVPHVTRLFRDNIRLLNGPACSMALLQQGKPFGTLSGAYSVDVSAVSTVCLEHSLEKTNRPFPIQP